MIQKYAENEHKIWTQKTLPTDHRKKVKKETEKRSLSKKQYTTVKLFEF